MSGDDVTDYSKHHRMLELIRDRYAWKRKLVNHHSDCEIYRAIEMYGFAVCTCGLIHDLRVLHWEMAERLFPKYAEHRSREDDCWIPNPAPNGYSEEHPYPYIKPHREPISKEEAEAWLLKCGFTLNTEPFEVDEKPIWAEIESVFGEESTHLMKLEYQQAQMAKDVGEY